jgi:glucan phosphoethanolaminetransferase (alkaline phosphatase superfamily)
MRYKKLLPLLALCFLCILIPIAFGYFLKPFYILSSFILCILLASMHRKIYVFYIYTLAFIAALYAPTAVSYGSPDFNMVQAIFYSNITESYQFIGSQSLSGYFISALILVLAFISSRISFDLNIYTKSFLGVIILLSIFFTPVKNFYKNGRYDFFDYDMTEFQFIADFIKNYKLVRQEENRIEKTVKMKDSWQPYYVNPAYDTYILVIGESVRRDFMGVYGFPINDTPFVSGSNGLFFTNYLSASFTTQVSLTHTLSLQQNNIVEINNNIITLAKKSGFHTYWISNQGALGLYETPTASMGFMADDSVFLKKGEARDKDYSPDTVLVPYISNALKNKSGKKLIVIHLMGSHPPACVRTKGSYNNFFVSKEISCYIKSIENTDTLLSDIVSMAKKSNTKWSLMYFSDHGLSSDKNKGELRLIHNGGNKQNFEVPMFITSYDSKHKDNITKQRSAIHFLELFSTWLGIKDHKIKIDCDMLKNNECADQNKVFISNYSMKNYEDLNADSSFMK